MNRLPSRFAARPLCIAASLLAALALAACGARSHHQPGGAPAHPQPLDVAEVLVRPFADSEEFSGRIEATERVEIRARVAGYIQAVPLRAGAEVRKGELLFTIDPRPYQAEVERTEAVAAAARAKAALAHTELERARKLAVQHAIAQRELDQRVAAAEELDAQARAAQAAYESAKLNLAFTRVVSPISGRVGKAEVTQGNLVDSGVLLTTVVSDHPLYASFDASQSAFMKVKQAARAGRPVDVRIAAADEEGFGRRGTLVFVDNQLDPVSGTMRMRARFDNHDKQLVPGLFARIRLAEGGAPEKAVLVAERAVLTDQDRKFVYVVSGEGKAVYREVRLGPAVDRLRLVREGLAPGERIVLNGLHRVRPGAPVKPNTVAMDSPPREEPMPSAAPSMPAGHGHGH